MPPSVRLQLWLVTTVKVSQMRHPPVSRITAVAAAVTAESRPSSVPATMLLHATAPRDGEP